MIAWALVDKGDRKMDDCGGQLEIYRTRNKARDIAYDHQTIVRVEIKESK